jgi:hypothetical protein
MNFTQLKMIIRNKFEQFVQKINDNRINVTTINTVCLKQSPTQSIIQHTRKIATKLCKREGESILR